jgi:hypothetical protein
MEQKRRCINAYLRGMGVRAIGDVINKEEVLSMV